MAKETISSYTMAEIQKMIAEVDYWPTSPDAPEIELDEDFWQNARIVMPKPAPNPANEAVSHHATRRMAEESSDDA